MGVRAPHPPNPLIAQPTPHRPRSALRLAPTEFPSQDDQGQSIEGGPPSRRTRSISHSQFRTIGIRKAELVEDGDEYLGEGKKSKGKWKSKAREVDEDCDEYLEEGKKSKGKGKVRQVDEDMDVDADRPC